MRTQTLPGLFIPN